MCDMDLLQLKKWLAKCARANRSRRQPHHYLHNMNLAPISELIAQQYSTTHNHPLHHGKFTTTTSAGSVPPDKEETSTTSESTAFHFGGRQTDGDDSFADGIVGRWKEKKANKVVKRCQSAEHDNGSGANLKATACFDKLGHCIVPSTKPSSTGRCFWCRLD
jgi:hypothetical protein